MAMFSLVQAEWYAEECPSTLKEGFPIERFVEPPRDEFKCMVCYGVVRSPKECQVCGILLCGKCEKTCVSDRQEFACPSCRTNKLYRQPSKVLVKLIEKLHIKCKYFVHGCQAVTPIQDIKAHQHDCEFKTTKCGNSLLCSKRGNITEFLYYSDANKFVCSEVCKKLVIMEMSLAKSDLKTAICMYRQALEKDT